MFYVESLEDVKKVIDCYNPLVADDIEVAFGTNNADLAFQLSVGKVLVVKPSTYYPSLVVTDKEFDTEVPVMSTEELRGVVNAS